MTRFAPLVALLSLTAAATALVAAGPGGRPREPVLPGVEPGLWEISQDATGRGGRKGCIRDVVLLATYAHAGDRCLRTYLTNKPRHLILELDCGRGDFARSHVTVITPRSLKIESQGFHKGEPYNNAIYARRVGECPVPSRR